MKLATIVNKAVSLSEVMYRYWETEGRKHHPHYPLVYPGEEEVPPPPQMKKLRELLSSLPEETLYKLALIRYVGEGRFDTSELQQGYQYARDYWEKPAQLLEMLVEAPLEDSLPEGMESLKKAGIDLDKMDFTVAQTGN